MDASVNGDDLSKLVADLEEEKTIFCVKKRITRGDDPFLIIEQCQRGMQQVGESYEKGFYYVSGLIMAGEIMHQVAQIVLPVLEDRIKGKDSGCIVLGTVKGDIHYLGKDIVKVLLSGYGFTVHDLGVDVPSTEFLEAAKGLKPDIIGLSCLLNTSYESMKETIELIRGTLPGTRPLPNFIVGGLIDEQVRRYVGADYWAADAMTGVRLCQLIVKGK